MAYIPTRSFSAGVGDKSINAAGPEQLIADLDILFKMFDPNAFIDEEETIPGGIDPGNIALLTPDQTIATAFAGNGTLITILSQIAKSLKAIIGETNWYSTPDSNIHDLALAIAAAIYTHPNHYGDVFSVGDGAQTIQNGVVTLAKMANMATSSLIYRRSAGTGVPEVNTLAQLKADLGVIDPTEVLAMKDMNLDTGVGDLHFYTCTQEEYDAITEKDTATLYFIKTA